MKVFFAFKQILILIIKKLKRRERFPENITKVMN